MQDHGTRSSYFIAAIGGAALWLLAVALSGQREAWDSSLYWMLAYPFSIVLAGVLGYRAPENPWRWALTVMLAQAVVLALTAGSFGLLPLGLFVFAILALPAIAVAHFAARMRLRKP